MTSSELEKLNYLIDTNTFIFNCVHTSMYDKDSLAKTKAIGEYNKNIYVIKELLGLTHFYSEKEARVRAEAIKETEKHREHIDAFADLIKDTLEDIKSPSVTRTYKINPDNKNVFDVITEKVDPNELNVVHDPFKELKEEPDVTREQWDASIVHHEQRFNEQFEQIKQYYSPELAKATQNKWGELVKTEIILDDEIIGMAKGFMLGPVGLYNGRAIAAEFQKFDNLAEMKIFLGIQSKTKDMVLYMTFKQNGSYCWRGAFVNSTEDRELNHWKILDQS